MNTTDEQALAEIRKLLADVNATLDRMEARVTAIENELDRAGL